MEVDSKESVRVLIMDHVQHYSFLNNNYDLNLRVENIQQESSFFVGRVMYTWRSFWPQMSKKLIKHKVSVHSLKIYNCNNLFD